MCLKQILGCWSSDKVIFVADGFFSFVALAIHQKTSRLCDHIRTSVPWNGNTNLHGLHEKSKFDFTRMLETTKQLKNTDLAFEKMLPRLAHVDSFSSTIHFGSRRPSVRNNVSNKQASALFFQNAFTSWVHHASFLKLCFDQRLLPVVF